MDKMIVLLPNFLEKPIVKYYQRRGVNLDQRWWNEFRKNPRIIRHFDEWSKLRDGQTNTLVYGLPWYTFGAIDWLENNLRTDMKVFEWGSGGSTIFYSQRVKSVTSVEHDATWYKDVVKEIGRRRIKKTETVIIEPSRSRLSLVSDQPGDYRSAIDSMAKLDYADYCKYIRRFPNEHFDLIAIDGRARTSCVLEAIPKLKSGGFILLDNSDRDKYLPGAALLTGWDRKDFTGPLPYIDDFLRTSVFRKP